MSFLQKIDGSKTYILAIITGVFTLIHFMVTGDYSLASFIQLSQDATVLAMVAALRHGIAKAGNQGVISQGGK
jgi:hypothetical protein